MDDKNEIAVEEAQADVEELDSKTEEEKDTTDWKAKYEETAGRLKRAETKLEKSKIEKKADEILEKRSQTGELDETQLDYLDVKGYTEPEDLKIIERHVQRTGETVRQALKDEYVVSKLNANKSQRDVKNATPASTKRGGNQTNDLASALAKFEQTGELPTDFALKSAVINAKVDKSNTNKPNWH